MLKEKPILRELAQEVFKQTSHLSRGDIIPHRKISSITGIAPYEKGWSSIIKKLKALFLKEKSIQLWPIVGVGYKLNTTTEQLHHSIHSRSRRARKQINKGVQEADVLPPGELSAHQQRIRAAGLSSHVATRRLLKRQSRELKVLSKATETVWGRKTGTDN